MDKQATFCGPCIVHSEYHTPETGKRLRDRSYASLSALGRFRRQPCLHLGSGIECGRNRDRGESHPCRPCIWIGLSPSTPNNVQWLWRAVETKQERQKLARSIGMYIQVHRICNQDRHLISTALCKRCILIRCMQSTGRGACSTRLHNTSLWNWWPGGQETKTNSGPG
jgi:hypothetical protein